MDKEAILLAHRKHVFPAVFHFFNEPLVISHAENQFVYDADGNEYLDFFGGIVTVSVGHCNDFVTDRVHRQLDRLNHVSPVFVTAPQAVWTSSLINTPP